MRITELDKRKLNKVKFGNGGLFLGLNQYFATPKAASKNYACFRSGQKWLKNIYLA